MRKTTLINEGWSFFLGGEEKKVNLPHCWNASDGCTKDYLRAEARYSKTLEPSDKTVFLLVEGANSVARVVADGKEKARHKGGYGAFAADITDCIKNGCRIDIYVDNRDFEDVFPTRADFTFWGGLYRNVKLIETESCHFSFRDHGSCGVYARAVKSEEGWRMSVKALIDSPREDYKLRCTLLDREGKVFAQGEAKAEYVTELSFKCENPILWDGVKNPYLYTLRCEIKDGERTADNIDIKTGFRTFCIDSEKGFFLNGRHMKLKGVSRHQDRQGMGNAVTEKEHREDIELILEAGADSVRLAHYQQSEYFYDLCDEKGLLVWAEAPVISAFAPAKRENGKSQLTELIKQNFNHPSIFCWGIENEITQELSGAKDKRLLPYLRELGGIVRKLDPSRYSSCAQLSILEGKSPLNSVTDILGYNHYFGWYDFSFDYLSKWLDRFHESFPERKLCLSEYGAEGLLNIHSKEPVQGDYSEEYQCVFHENYLREINSRPWLWGSYVWNMFDFGAANRHEGGMTGRNNKGLVTYDRKIKKDSFYLCKAFWSEKKFVHICSGRYKNREAGRYDIKVYSNLGRVKLTVNEREYELEGERIFLFKDVPIGKGENRIFAQAEDCSDGIAVFGAEKDDPSYSLKEGESLVRNWAKKSGEEAKNYLSPSSTIRDLVKSRDAHNLVKGKLGRDYLNIPLLKLLYPVKLSTAVRTAGFFGLSENHCALLTQYTYSIKK